MLVFKGGGLCLLATLEDERQRLVFVPTTNPDNENDGPAKRQGEERCDALLIVPFLSFRQAFDTVCLPHRAFPLFVETVRRDVPPHHAISLFFNMARQGGIFLLVSSSCYPLH